MGFPVRALWYLRPSLVLFILGVAAIAICALATSRAPRGRRLAWRVGAVVLVVLILTGVSAWRVKRFASHVVEPAAYEAVDKGMTKDQVAALLGEPPDRSLDVWRYGKPGVWEFAQVSFDAQGRVRQKFLDR